MKPVPVSRLAARDEKSDLTTVVIETPRGSRNKFKYDEELGIFRLSKVLPAGFAFPHDFGFVPSTRGEDGDPLDVLVLAEEPLFPGCVVGTRLVGVIEVEQKEDGKSERNDRLIAAVETPFNAPEVSSLDEMPTPRLEQIAHFFVSFNAAHGRELEVVGRGGPSRAHELVREGGRRFEDAQSGLRAQSR